MVKGQYDMQAIKPKNNNKWNWNKKGIEAPLALLHSREEVVKDKASVAAIAWKL